MKALPSIAFSEFTGSAGDVTARSVGGRTLLNHKAYQSKVKTPSQAVSRNTLSKVSRAYKQLTDSQMKAWGALAEHLKGISTFGDAARMTAHNAFVRINANRSLVGRPLLAEAPAYIADIPEPDWEDYWVTPDKLVFQGVEPPKESCVLVVRMGQAKSNGVSSGWSDLVIITPDMVPDWGDVDLFEVYTKRFGLDPVLGQKYFIDMYWLDTETGFTGEAMRTSTICSMLSHVHHVPYKPSSFLKVEDFSSGYGEYIPELSVFLSEEQNSVALNGGIELRGTSGNVMYPYPSDFTEAPVFSGVCLARGSLGQNRVITMMYIKSVFSQTNKYISFSECSRTAIIAFDMFDLGFSTQ